jgi:hypothetical protein
MVPAAVILGVVLSVLLLLFLLQAITKGVAAQARQRIEARFPAGDVVLSDDLANCFGFTSKGPLQNRGNGGLVLARDTVWFLPILGDEWRLPVAKITAAERVSSHLGKTVGRPLLRIEWEGDSVAFFVRDVDTWITRLKP